MHATFGPFVQVAYLVPDARAAAHSWATRFRAGPFFLFEHIPLESVVHRGRPASLDHTSAYGQHGSVMIELVQTYGDGPSVFTDVYADGEFGVHHLAYFADDLDAELARLDAAGISTAMTARTATGTRFAFADARLELGHMLEIYQDDSGLRGFYGMVAAAAESWDGREPIRSLGQPAKASGAAASPDA